MKKIVLLTALLTLLGAGCTKQVSPTLPAHTATTNQSAKKVGSPVTSVDINTWQTYTHSASGFSFRYPLNWSILTANASYSVCLAEASTSQSCDIGVNIVKAPDERHPSGVQSNEELIAAFKKKYASEKIETKLAVVNGLHTAKYSVAEETQIFIETKTYDYVLAISQHDAAGTARSDYAKISQVLNLLATTISVEKQ